MILDFGGWVLIFLFIFAVMTVPAAFLIIRRLTEETKISDTVVILHSGKRSNGRVIGNLIDKIEGKNGRLHIRLAS